MSIAVAAAFSFVGPAKAGDADDIAVAINAYNGTLNKGDFPGAAAYYASSPTIIDEFTPHVWTGADAFMRWGADYGVFAKDRGMADPSMALGKPDHVTAEGDHGYAVFPAVFSFKLKGSPAHEDGTMTSRWRRPAALEASPAGAGR